MKTTVVLLVLGLCLAACGDEPSTVADAFRVPSWAKVAPEQIAEAKKHGVPVAFENDLGMRFVLIPAGTFLMGSPEGEEGRYERETQHEVTISRPFYMQITEATNGEYRKYKPDHRSGDYKGHSLDGESQPVVAVTWEDARSFAVWLEKQDPARTYRLPTEAEWEHACRTGRRTAYVWGNGAGEGWRHANANDPKTKGAFGFGWPGWPRDDGHRVTAPTATYPATPWGLHDLHGNVGEWCSDWYGEYPQARVTDPMGPTSGTMRVSRGGSWRSNARFVRSAKRDWNPPVRPCDIIGFRLVSPLPVKAE